MEIIKRTYRQSAFILIPAAILSAFIEWKKLPLSILIGGSLSLVNLKGLQWGITGLVGSGEKVTGALVFFSLIRLFIMTGILILLLWLRLINIAGVFAGITIVLVLLLREGLRSAKNEVPGNE